MKRIVEEGHNCWTVFETDAAGILVDGRDYYRAFYKAASKAKRSIFISGWQFDSEVRLLRGDEEKAAGGETRLLPFLDSLCEKEPALNIYILAWDFSLFFIQDHELAQKAIFNWTTNKRLRFMFDKTHAAGASHHQKLIVIDCNFAFIGGLDISSSHWDDREHAASNPDRVDADGTYYAPYHDAVCWLTGQRVMLLAEYFRKRWTDAGGMSFGLGCGQFPAMAFEGGLPMPPGDVAISRTEAMTLDPPREQVLEIKHLYLDAIAAAGKMIYIENQYFTSTEIYLAIVRRMKDLTRPGLQVIIILPRMFNAFLEEISLGLAQTKMLTLLERAAADSNVPLGIYYSSSLSPEGLDVFAYIHSKIMVIDDRLLTLGSANTSNRSMSLDTELNVTWEAGEGDDELKTYIRRVRDDLLAEHLGVTGKPEAGRLNEEERLVELLNTFADSGLYRLHRHGMETLFGEYKWIKGMAPEDMAFDPTEPIIDEELWESIFSKRGGIISGPAEITHEKHGRLRSLRKLHFEWMALLAALAVCGLLFWLLVIK